MGVGWWGGGLGGGWGSVPSPRTVRLGGGERPGGLGGRKGFLRTVFGPMFDDDELEEAPAPRLGRSLACNQAFLMISSPSQAIDQLERAQRLQLQACPHSIRWRHHVTDDVPGAAGGAAGRQLGERALLAAGLHAQA